MSKLTKLIKQQLLTKKEIYKNLDLIIGSVVRSPSMMNYSLTTKIDGKTVTRYVRKGLVPEVKKMTMRHQEVRSLIRKLSKINWELLLLESKK